VDVLRFLVKTLTDLYLLVFMLRLIVQWVRADYYNPFSQFIVRATNPLIVPARRLLPSVGNIELPTIVVLVLLQCLVTYILLALLGATMDAFGFIILVGIRLIRLVIWTYTIAIFIYVILSWIAQAGYNPIALVLVQVVDPVLRPVRRIIPPIAGLDLSPLLVLILLQAASIGVGVPHPLLR
jgi:YggT family protein